MRKIPVFVSVPSTLSTEQDSRRKIIMKLLDELQLEARALGRSDYAKDYPLKEVFLIAKHCAGGIILGFEQFYIEKGIEKRNVGNGKEKAIGKDQDKNADNTLILPTPWNHVEAGILFGLKLPLLIFKEEGIKGGIFDFGILDVFIHEMPPIVISDEKYAELKQVFLKWYGEVSRKYNKY